MTTDDVGYVVTHRTELPSGNHRLRVRSHRGGLTTVTVHKDHVGTHSEHQSILNGLEVHKAVQTRRKQ